MDSKRIKLIVYMTENSLQFCSPKSGLPFVLTLGWYNRGCFDYVIREGLSGDAEGWVKIFANRPDFVRCINLARWFGNLPISTTPPHPAHRHRFFGPWNLNSECSGLDGSENDSPVVFDFYQGNQVGLDTMERMPIISPFRTNDQSVLVA